VQGSEQLGDPVARALAYPYEIPSRSFLVAADSWRALEESDPAAVPSADRTPLLAYGSNAAPEVLSRKLGASTVESPVVALRTTLSDFDVVYSAHVSRYGSIPATLERSPGTKVSAFLVYVTEAQIALISPTEPNYELVGLRNASCSLERGRSAGGVVAYVSRHGNLLVEGSEVALAAIDAEGRRLPEMTQPETLEHARAIVAAELTLAEFITAAAASPQQAAQYTAALQQPQ
jgi:hypothetical protein